MPIGRIEPTGCTVRKGKIQLRLSFYLEPDDPRYEEHYVQAPIIPEEGYLGKRDARGRPVDSDDYNKWLEGLPKKWQNNPFHNHFVYVDADTPDAETKQLMGDSLKEFFAMWSRGEDIVRIWKPKAHPVAGDISPANIEKCQKRVESITNRASDFEVRKV